MAADIILNIRPKTIFLSRSYVRLEDFLINTEVYNTHTHTYTHT